MAVAMRLGRYTVGERIGSGGLAEVHLASAEGADGFAKQLVVKRIRGDLLGEAGAVDALRSEARLAQRLSHGNVVHVFDYGQDEDGSPYIVMEHVDGCSLRELVEDLAKRGERLELADALFVIEEVAAALHYAHGLSDDDGMPLGIVHRDVKPGNILVSRDGVVKLTDFGIAKTRALPLETIPGLVKGTPRYLAPEQAADRPVDARADVYGLGVVLGELLAGDEDDELSAIAKRATEPAPRDRYEDVDAMADALHGWRQRHGMRLRPDRLAELVRRAQGRPGKTRPIALDAALLGGGRREPDTVHVLAGADAGARPRRWPIVVGVVSPVVVVAAWVAMAGPEPVVGELRSQEQSQSQNQSPEPEPEPEPEPIPNQVPIPIPIPIPDPTPNPTVDAGQGPEVVRRTGRLRINVLPYAEVSLDGKSLGRTPIVRALRAGQHRLTLHNPNTGKTVRRRIDVKPGEELSIIEWE